MLGWAFLLLSFILDDTKGINISPTPLNNKTGFTVLALQKNLFSQPWNFGLESSNCTLRLYAVGLMNPLSCLQNFGIGIITIDNSTFPCSYVTNRKYVRLDLPLSRIEPQYSYRMYRKLSLLP